MADQNTTTLHADMTRERHPHASIWPEQRMLIRCQTPPGRGTVAPLFALAASHGITLLAHESDGPGMARMVIYNTGMREITIRHGDAVAQWVSED